MAKASFEETHDRLVRGACHAELDIMRGVSANVMCGQEGIFGTNSFSVLLDMEKLQSFRPVAPEEKLQEEIIEDMFQGVEDASNICTNEILSSNTINKIKNHLNKI